VEYADGTVVEYIYDNMGNRLLKSTRGINAPANNPPGSIAAPSIPDGSGEITTAPTMTWTGSDPDSGDQVAYYTYFGECGNLSLVSSGLSPIFSPGQLISLTSYCWQVNSRDSHNVTTAGPVLSFTTRNDPPVASFTNSAQAGPVPWSVSFYDTSKSVDDYDAVVAWAWDFNNDGVTDSSVKNPTYTYSTTGTYSVSLAVTDARGLVGTVTKIGLVTVLPDSDLDRVHDGIDNCPLKYNPNQADMDSNGLGDICDPDLDGDGIVNQSDNCPLLANPSQGDGDVDGYGDACTVVHCVTTSAEFQNALVAAQANGKNDSIQVVQGAYGISGNASKAFSYYSSERYSVLVKGGYAASCATRQVNPSNTVLDGMNINQSYSAGVLDLSDASESSFAGFVIEGLTIRNGKSTNGAGGLQVSTSNGKVSILSNMVGANSATYYAGGSIYSGYKGHVKVINNVFANNTATTSGGGLAISSGTKLDIINNTITGNTVTSSSGSAGGLRLSVFGGSQVDLYNNIIWGNTAFQGGDVDIANSYWSYSAVRAYNNDFDPLKVSGAFASSVSNITVDPNFVNASNGDYHLAEASPCIDAGKVGAPSSPSFDFEGNGRSLGPAPDIGADEYYVSNPSYMITGRVESGGVGLGGVTVILTGPYTIQKVTDAEGYYTFAWLLNGTYTLTLSSPNYAFDPMSSTIGVGGSNPPPQNFTAIVSDRDLGFGNAGSVVTDFSGGNNSGYSMVIQGDGKILLAGDANGTFGIARYLPDGSLDPTFGNAGRVSTELWAYGAVAYAMAMQDDGKIVVSGAAYGDSGYADFGVARYNQDGTLDSTFGDNGRVSVDIGGYDDEVYATQIQGDGKILVAGYTDADLFGYDMAVARLNEDGSLDDTFGTAGLVQPAFGIGEWEEAYALAIQDDGKIVVGGYSNDGGTTSYDFTLLRYNPDGSIDNSFGASGMAKTSFSTNDDILNSLIIQSDGRIVAAGTARYLEFALARYMIDGSLDSSFGVNGKVTTAFPGGYGNYGQAATIQTDGKIIVAGAVSNVGTGDDFALARYGANGTLDDTFAAGGKISTDIGGDGQSAYAVAVQADGKIILGGTSGDYFLNQRDFALVRYLGDADSDHDGIAGTDDNCSTVFNPNQADADEDELGDACDSAPNTADRDSDGRADGSEDLNKNGTHDTNETDPGNPDTDGDGYTDGVEVDAGSNPLAFNSIPDTSPDSLIGFKLAYYVVRKSDGVAKLNVLRSGGSTGSVSVDYATANGTAMAGVDYTDTWGTLTFGPGDVGPKTITIPIADDGEPAGSLSFGVNLGNVTGDVALGSPSGALVTISDEAPDVLHFHESSFVPVVTAKANSMIWFEAPASAIGPNFVSYHWEFGDGGGYDGPNAFPFYIYANAGTYEVKVVAIDTAGTGTQYTAYVPISGMNQSPEVSAEARQFIGPNFTAVTSAPANSLVWFGAFGSDPDGWLGYPIFHWMGSDNIVSYLWWNFGDGAATGLEIFRWNPEHVFANEGTYSVSVNVYDNEGALKTAIVPITITGVNQSPQITSVTATLTSGRTFAFNVTAGDADGSIGYPVFHVFGNDGLLYYSWNFGDGQPVGWEMFSQSPSHTYPGPGTYTATVTTWDNRGVSTTASANVPVQ